MTEQELLNSVTEEFGFKPIEIFNMNKIRWVLHDREGLGPEMIRLERRLQELTKKPIDLRVQLKSDKNKRFDRNYLRGVDNI